MGMLRTGVYSWPRWRINAPRPRRGAPYGVHLQGLLGAGASWSPLGMEGVKYAGTGRGCPEKGVGQSSPPHTAPRGGQALLEKLTLILSAWAWSAHRAGGHLPNC